MTGFDRDFWQQHWADRNANATPTPHPYLAPETASLTPGTALDAGCGAGAEALWLAKQGWRVTAADISASVLDIARAHAGDATPETPVEWIETDLSRWQPNRAWDLVVTSYAHADIGQLALYRRLASWVASGGSLLIVGHAAGVGSGPRHAVGEHSEPEHAAGGRSGASRHSAHSRSHPHEATATREAIEGLFTAPGWVIETSIERTRTAHPGGEPVTLRDVIVRARRRVDA